MECLVRSRIDCIDPALAEASAEQIDEEVKRYLLTGESDLLYSAWPGDLLQRANQAHQDLRGALAGAVRRLSGGRTHHPVPEIDLVALTRSKVDSMVCGLFPRGEQSLVLETLQKSVVFLTSASIEGILYAPGFDNLAWTLANLYLSSLDAPLLGPDASQLMGLSDGTTCYVSALYFKEDPYADFIVHEAAHVFHNSKRAMVGLPMTRKKEWLLDIAYRKRETFAYSCEAYACVFARGKSRAGRRALAEDYAERILISDERVDEAEVAGIVREAAAARNGWKVILAHCSANSLGV